MTIDAKERPILFSGPMVRAILDGRKTQTRQAIRHPVHSHIIRHMEGGAFLKCANEENWWLWVQCPYGIPGDRLWVQETWAQTDGRHEQLAPLAYRATYDGSALLNDLWIPSIHMPRWASRITLEVTGIRVERLQDISEKDSIAEGIEAIPDAGPNAGPNRYSIDMGGYWSNAPTAAGAYRMLWESINGLGSWDLNPWVWVVEFKETK